MALNLKKAVMVACRRDMTAVGFMLAILALFAGGTARAQSLMVLPVNVRMAPGQRTASVTVVNHGDTETSIQIRAYAWTQPNGKEQLTLSDVVLVSPPIASIAPGGTQIVRLVLRQSPQDREATYRILLDQIPPPATPGTVRVVLRMSIPIFAQPATRTAPRLTFHVERDAEKLSLVAVNDGTRHEVLRDIVLSTSDGRKLQLETGASPYVLGGVTRHWSLKGEGSQPAAGETLRLTAHADSGAIDEQVRVVSAP
jgi:fimbrial chaperone protein